MDLNNNTIVNKALKLNAYRGEVLFKAFIKDNNSFICC